jgi:hypothetical protein
MYHAQQMSIQSEKSLKSEQKINHKKLTYICNAIKYAVSQGNKSVSFDEDVENFYRITHAELIYLKLYGYQVQEPWWGIIISWRVR